VQKLVTFDSGPLRLYGTLTLPKTATTKVPIALLLAASGPFSRDETIGVHRLLADLAGLLAKSGVASLRFDKRYFTYKNTPASVDAAATIENEALADARAALSAVRNGAFEGVDPERIVVVGHNEGCQVAAAIASEGAVKAGIFLAPPTLDIDQEILRRQAFLLRTRDGLKSEVAEEALQPLRDGLAKVKAGIDVADVPISASYMRSLEPFGLLKLASKLTMPILIIHGAADFQIDAKEAKMLANVLEPVNPAVTLVEVPDVNNVFRTVPGGVSDGRDYQTVGPIAPSIKEALAGFAARVILQQR
jgi:dienelactone hydrolase